MFYDFSHNTCCWWVSLTCSPEHTARQCRNFNFPGGAGKRQHCYCCCCCCTPPFTTPQYILYGFYTIFIRLFVHFIRFSYVFFSPMNDAFSPNIISLGRPPVGDKHIISQKTIVETMLLSIISQVFFWIWDFFESINLTLRYL